MGQTNNEVIKCPTCGQLNRISSSEVHENKRPLCSKCWSSLKLVHTQQTVPPPPPKQESVDSNQDQAVKSNIIISWVKISVIVIIISVTSYILINLQSENIKDTSNSIDVSQIDFEAELPPIPEPQLPAKPLPANGAIKLYTTAEPVAPLRILGNDDNHYFIKIVDFYYNSPIMTIFVHSNSATTVNVPLGTFEIKLASGKKWYGYENLFGPQTIYSKASQKFDFSISGNQVSGYTITLYNISGGNLRTSTITASQF